ncbi:MAG TPA: Calx-beta domain-containing protein [Chloroflexia bacterium]|nr:Calx-beta domain-containing protein [Chloroflexia bacterium]
MILLRSLPLTQLHSTTRRLAGRWVALALIIVVALNLLQLGFPAGVARAAAYPCSEAGLDAALAAGGVATFSCAAPTTITLTTAKTITVSGTVLDGGTLLTLDGRNVANSMFYVPSGVTATFQNIALTKGQGQNVGGNYFGGAIFTRGAVVLLNDIFSNNGISNGTNMSGGAIYSEGNLTVQSSTFYGNQGYFGSAIDALYTNIDIANSTFTANASPQTVRMSGNVNNSTFYGNPTYDLVAYNSINLRNSIVGGLISTGLINLGNNLIGTNPLLNPLANNGGFVPTMSLQPCSPAINAGNSAGAPATDERGAGFPRILQGAIDIGAFESNLLPCVSVNNVTHNEGNAGVTYYSFNVSLSGAASTTITVNFATADGTATTADNDYTAFSGTLTFPPGTITQTVNVAVNGDTKFEPDETFSLNLSNPANATLGANKTGTGTIVNDDNLISLSIGNVTKVEGNSGTTAFDFPVTLSSVSSQPITVDYATADGTATTADNDYSAASGTLTIPAGQTSGTITINVNGDSKLEPDETFSVNLSNPTNAIIGTATGTGTITNDDGVPTLAINDVSQAEGNSGTTAFNFTVTLSNPSAQPVTVDYATADGTATTADSDYAAASATLTIPAGQTIATITINVNGDTKFEPDETFTLTLSKPTGAALAKATGTGTIVNDDSVPPPPPVTPVLSVSDVRQLEGNTGTTAFNFTVQLSTAVTGTVTVNYATQDQTATLADKDYQGSGGSLTFAPGETVKTVTVLVNGDTRIEPDEVFLLILTNPAGATLGKATGQGVILNDDGEVGEADLVGKLRVTPDREFDLDGDGLLTYVLVIKNIGTGASSRPVIQLPIDSKLEVAYASFSTDSVPGAYYEKTVTDAATAVLPYAVLPYAQLRLPVLAPGQVVTATVAMRAAAGATPGDLSTRFAIVWDNLDSKQHHYYSNRVHLHLGNGTTRNETDGLVQFLSVSGEGTGLDEQGRATLRLRGDFYAPGERVYLWYTDAGGNSTGLGYVWADQYTGELDTQLTIPGWQSGQRYFLAASGARSGVIGSATVLVEAGTSDSASNGYSYTEIAPLFSGEALQTTLKPFIFNQ